MTVFRALETRRQSLGMSRPALASRSCVSLPTVNRILSGRHLRVSFESVVAVATALGVELTAVPSERSDALRRRQAHSKARRLVGIVQGTSALEGQGLRQAELEALVTLTAAELMRSKSRLWSD